MNIAIKAERLSKIYKKQVVFKDLNLNVFEGEVFGLLGLNGAGKTTLMKILLGLIFPSSGQAWILGKKIGNKSVKREIGFLPEIPYFSRYSTPEEILSYYASLFEIEKRQKDRLVEDALDKVGLLRHKKKKLAEFSKGMLQRVGMAQLVLNDPSVIFMDEPTFGLDPLINKELRDLICLMKKEGKTIFLSSHQIAEVEKICDRIGILHNGKIIKVSNVQKPLEEFFINSIDSK